MSLCLRRVEGGLYANASEVMRTALRLLEKEEREYEEKLAALRAAIAEGDAQRLCGWRGVFRASSTSYIDELAEGEGARKLPKYSCFRSCWLGYRGIIRYTTDRVEQGPGGAIRCRPA